VAADELKEPRPLSHYRTVLGQRLDPDKGHLYAMRDRDLLPPSALEGEPLEPDPVSEMTELVQTEGLLQANMHAKAQKQLDELRAELVERGLEPSDYDVPEKAPAPQPAPDLDELSDFMDKQLALAEDQKTQAATATAAAVAQARKECEERGIDYDEAVEKARKESAGPPKFRADAELQRLKDQIQLAENAGVPLPAVQAQLDDPELFQKLKKNEELQISNYRRYAQHFPAAATLEGDEASRLRAEVEQAWANGESLAGRDLTGADLAGMSLRGLDLSGAFLEAANLAGCDLGGCQLSDAVFTRADLSDAVFSGSTMTRVNLGQAKLRGADLSGGIDMSEAVLAGSDLGGANLSGATLDKADLSEARFDDTDFSGVHAKQVNFLQCDLRGLKLAGAQLSQCNFVETNVLGVDFSGTTLEATTFVTAEGDGAIFRDAKADNLRVVHESSFARADFHGAELRMANFRGTNLEAADFSEAILESSDLSECNLQRASLERAAAPSALLVKSDLRRANLTRANLMMSILQKANLEGANFAGANLFRADFAKIKGNDATNFDGANMNQIRFVNRSKHEQG
jgi:uncharacterized protein YjbI with pentapeptide repeats